MKFNKYSLIGLILLISCSIGTTNWNDHIDANSRTQIKELNNKLIEALQEKNSRKLKEIFSDKLNKTSAADLDILLAKVENYLVSPNFKILDEYKTNAAIGTTTSVFKGVSGEYDYKVNFEVMNKETFVSLILNEGISSTTLLTCIYGKYGDDWKLNILQIGPYSIFGKNAVDFYKQAKADYEKGNLIDAADDIAMVQQTAAPANEIFQYQKDEEMKTFATKVYTEANKIFHLPLKVEAINTNPKIYNISPQVMNEGIFPMVTYISKINLKDTVSLKNENEELKKIIGTLFPGVDKDKKYVFFQVYNEIPTGKTPIEHYGFVLNVRAQQNGI